MEKDLILVLNCGSSSIKFSVLNPKTKDSLISGLIQCIETSNANIKYQIKNTLFKNELPNIGYKQAVQFILNIIKENKITDRLLAIGHRVVNGGEKFTSSVLINDETLSKFKECIDMAPLHNPAHLIGIEVTKDTFPTIKQSMVFDTAFHQSIPNYAYIYPIPYELYDKYKIRRYGAHGTSHRYVSNQAAKLLGKDIKKSSFITAHLGNGCSITSILNGKSMDTSMGFTPLAGIMMGTRSGDIDPSIHFHLANKLGYDFNKINNMLNKESGLLGISGIDSDMRTIEDKAISGNERAILAIEIFCYILAKYIAALTVPLERLDALIFTGGIGENSPIVRNKTLNLLKIFGFSVSKDLNEENGKSNSGIITKENSPIAMVVKTNEELLIAEDTLDLISIS